MHRINIHYITVFITFIATVIFYKQFGNETFVFFGLSENKEMEIRVEHPATIEHIYITPGSRVNKGDLLMEVTKAGMELTQSDLNHEVAELESNYILWQSNLKSSINRLQAQKMATENAIKTQIDQLESEMSINRSLIKDLESINPIEDNKGRTPNQIKIDGLKKDLKLAVRPILSEIGKLRNELNAPDNPIKIQIDKLKTELGFVHQEEEKLKLFAPTDGIVGTIFCKAGEQLPSFQTLVTFYEENPTQVKAYVIEKLILKVKLGDSILVSSGNNPSDTNVGVVIGMGSRIVEIPERLRRNPMFKTYGREILIEIPPDNNFLQKEKVTLKLAMRKYHSTENQLLVSTPKEDNPINANN